MADTGGTKEREEEEEDDFVCLDRSLKISSMS